MISYQIIKRIKDETNIVSVVGEYVKLTKKGSSFFGLCPFHDDHNPTMSVTNEKKVCTCWSCGYHLNVIDFVSKIDNITFDQAAIKLAKRLNIEIDSKTTKYEEQYNRLVKIMADANDFYRFYLNNSVEGKLATEYLHSRDLTDEDIKLFDIGLSPAEADIVTSHLINKKKHNSLDLIEIGLSSESNGKLFDSFRKRIMFPLKDQLGNTVGYSGRIYYESDQSRYKNSLDNKLFHKNIVLYNLHLAKESIRKLNQVFIFEGFMDVIAAYKAGITNGVATMGTMLTDNHIKTLSSLTNNIVLCFDGDSAGIKALMRSTEILSKKNIVPNAVVIPEGLDPDEYQKKYGKAKLNEYLSNNIKTAYEWLYILAKKDLIKADLASCEKFKNTIFSYISLCSQDTIVNYYLTKISAELEAGTINVKNDFDKFLQNNRQFSAEINYTPKENNVKKVISSDSLVTKGVKTAYEMVILYALDNPGAAMKYFDKTKEYYPGNLLHIEYSILLELRSIEQNYVEDVPKNIREILIKNLRKEKTFNNYIDNLLSGHLLLDYISDLDFEQCLSKINRYLNRLQTTLSKNRYLTGDKNALKDFVSSKKKENSNA